MAHEPQHPHNPCSLDENQRTPAKIWELLRRNEKFRRVVSELHRIDALEVAKRAFGPGRTSDRIVDALKKRHAFAAAALQWLVPEPDFRVWQIAAPQSFDSSGCFAYDILVEGRGTTPDPDDHQNWSWIKNDKGRPRGAVGVSFRRGPTVLWTKCDDLRFQDKINPLAEWRDYSATRKFALDTPWREAPPGFRENFCHLWRQHDSRAVGPRTGLRHDAPEPHETDFFQNWHLATALFHAAKTGQSDSEDLVRILQFENLAKDYRVFAIPKSIRSRMAARRMADWLVEQLARLPDNAELPKRESEDLGSSLLWDMLLVYEDRRGQADEHVPALQFTFDHLYLRLPAARRHAAKPVERSLDAVLQHQVARKMLTEAESTRWHSWLNDFARIHSPTTGQGLVQLVFPSLQTALAKSSSQSAT